MFWVLLLIALERVGCLKHTVTKISGRDCRFVRKSFFLLLLLLFLFGKRFDFVWITFVD